MVKADGSLITSSKTKVIVSIEGEFWFLHDWHAIWGFVSKILSPTCAKECSDILTRKNNPRNVIALSWNLNCIAK